MFGMPSPGSGTRSKESPHQIDDTIIGVQYWQVAPFIERETRMRNIEANHVPNVNVVAFSNMQVGMLVHDVRECPLGGRSDWFRVPWAIVKRGSRQAGVEGRIAFA
jgi:hypothetical protein